MNNPQCTDAYFYYWCGIGRGMVVTFSCDAKLQQFLNYIYLFNQKSLSLQELKPDVFIIGQYSSYKTDMIHTILVIRFRRVGDSVLSMALCHSLKLSFPKAAVHFVINKGIAPLYKDHPDIDKLITFNERECKGLTYIKKVREVMRSVHYDVIIDMRSTPKTLLFSLFSLSSTYRIGRKKWYNVVHTHRIVTQDGLDRVQSNLQLMEPLRAEGSLVMSERFPLYITPQEAKDYRAYLAKQGIDVRKPVVLVAVATRLEHKAWPRERMTEVLRRMLSHFDLQLVFNYAGDAEKAVATAYFEALGRDKRIFLNIEAKNLRELCALCQASQFFFGNEGGPRHISQAFEVPSLAIYPPDIEKDFWLPGHDERFQGVSPDDRMPLSRQKGMTYQERMLLITVEDVWQQLEPMLRRYVVEMPNENTNEPK